MNIRYPKPLAPGDLIAITAPSSGVAEPMHPRLDLALTALRNRGYRVVEGECLRQQAKQTSAPRDRRARELMSFLGDPEVSAGEGVLLYIENVEMHPCELLRALWSLRLHGWFDGLHGILVGRNAAADAKQVADLNYLDALRSACADISCPVLYDLDIGHLPPQLSLVNRALAHVSFQGDSGSVRQKLG